MNALKAYLKRATKENREALAGELLTFSRALLLPAGSPACERELREEAAADGALLCLKLARSYRVKKGTPESYFGQVILRVFARKVRGEDRRQCRDAKIIARLEEDFLG